MLFHYYEASFFYSYGIFIYLDISAVSARIVSPRPQPLIVASSHSRTTRSSNFKFAFLFLQRDPHQQQ
jgi:hypothetical protein